MATSTATTTAPAPTPTQETTNNTLLADRWTPEQELTLLKTLIRYKPVGLHAHFRMLSIHRALLASGTCTPDDEHTRIPGIWAKLHTLYDLDRLNAREDALITSSTSAGGVGGGDGDDGDDDEEEGSNHSQQDSLSSSSSLAGGAGAGKAYWRDFELPRDDATGGDFERLMWERRLAPEGSPEWGSGSVRGGRRESTVAGTDEPRSSPVPVPGSGRGTRSGGRRGGGRVSRLKGEATEIEGRSSSRRGSKAASEVGTGGKKDEDGDEEMEDAEEEEEETVESEDGEEEESSEPDEDEKRSGPAKRGRGGRRGRGRGRRRRG